MASNSKPGETAAHNDTKDAPALGSSAEQWRRWQQRMVSADEVEERKAKKRKGRDDRVLKASLTSQGEADASPELSTKAVCWNTLQKSEAERKKAQCECGLLHFTPEVCVKHIGSILRQCNACDRGCAAAEAHPPQEDVLASVLKWFGPQYQLQLAEEQSESAPRPTATSTDDLTAKLPVPGNTVSETTARGGLEGGEGTGDGPTQDETLKRTDPQHLVSFWREKAEQKFKGNVHLQQLWDEPWLPALLASPHCRKVLHCSCSKRFLKEFSEGYGVLLAVRDARRRHHLSRGKQQVVAVAGGSNKEGEDQMELPNTTGRGAVILDVCSGKGIGALMLAAALPEARVIALDANTEMDLTHFRACSGLEFRLLDVFSTAFPATIVQSLQEADWGAVVGTHLCGALSPRLVSVFRRCLRSVDCMVLSPCCFKGWGGKEAQKRAKEKDVDPYTQLCDDLCSLVLSSEIMVAPALDEGEALVARVVVDEGIASIRNRLIIAERRPNQG